MLLRLHYPRDEISVKSTNQSINKSIYNQMNVCFSHEGVVVFVVGRRRKARAMSGSRTQKVHCVTLTFSPCKVQQVKKEQG